MKIREQTGEYESFEKYLLNHGFELEQQNSETFPFTEQTGADDELTTNRIEKSDMTLTATVYTSGDTSIASGGWNVDPDTGTVYDTDITDNGHAPADVVGIGWEHRL